MDLTIHLATVFTFDRRCHGLFKKGEYSMLLKIIKTKCAMAILHATAVLAELRQLCYIRLLLVLMCMDYTV